MNVPDFPAYDPHWLYAVRIFAGEKHPRAKNGDCLLIVRLGSKSALHTELLACKRRLEAGEVSLVEFVKYEGGRYGIIHAYTDPEKIPGHAEIP